MKKKTVTVSILAVAGLMCAAFYTWSKGPSIATISPAKKDVKGSSIDVSTKLVTYDQLTIQVPSRFVAKQKTIGQAQPILVQELFTVPIKNTQSIFGDQLAVTIGMLTGGSLSNISDVQLRIRDSTYVLEQESENLLLFEKSTGRYEIGAFVRNNNQYASFVITGLPESATTLKAELKAIAASVIWK